MTADSLKGKRQKIEEEIIGKIFRRTNVKVRLVIRGHDRDEDGKIIEKMSERAWMRLVKPSPKEEYSGINQLGYARNYRDSKKKTMIVPFRTKDDTRYFSEIFRPMRDGSIVPVPVKPENRVHGFFVLERGTRKKYSNVRRSSFQEIFNRIIRYSIFEGTLIDTVKGTKETMHTAVGVADNRLAVFHEFYSSDLVRIYRQLVTASLEEEAENEATRLRERLELGMVKGDAAAIYLEKGDFKKNLARIIAIVEQYPFAALYAPTCVAVLRVFRNAVDRGFAKEGLRKIDWNSHVNGYMNKTQVNMPYIQLLRMYAGAQLGEKNRKALEGNLRSIGCGYLDDDLTEDMLAEELAEAREEVAETMQRETPPERERYTSASYNADDIFGSEEDDVSHSSDTADRVQGTGKRNSGNAGYKEEERAGSVGIDDDDDDDDFPF